jgi:Fe-S-cluster containining protein
MPDETPTEEKIIKEYPRMGEDDTFTFRCGKDLDCFTCCCQDVSIVLTPFDVLRMKKAVGLSSGEFLQKYTISPFTPEQKIPVVMLKMDKENKKCLFVNEEGCSIYTSRPWACRMYPLGFAEPQNPNPEDKKFYFLMKEELCHGHGEGEVRTVRDWIDNQGIEEYDMMGQSFKELMLHDQWDKAGDLTPQQMEMYFMACYDLDSFRRFVFDTKFLDMFLVDEDRLEVMKKDDVELLEFGMQWLRFALFKEKTLKIKRKVVEAWERKAAEQGAAPGPETMNERLANSDG